MMDQERTIEFILDVLGRLNDLHGNNSRAYQYIEHILKEAIDSIYSEGKSCKCNFGNFGIIEMPFFKMGEIDTTHLFGLDELIIFSFYDANKYIYKSVADLGANVGLHSIIMSNLGFKVTSYEPDPIHLEQLNQNIQINCKTNRPIIRQQAVSTEDGETEFIRVVGNTTGSHIAGAKTDPYGKLEKFNVPTKSFREILNNNDLLKIDVEGHEAEIIQSTTEEDWLRSDAIVEIGSCANATSVFEKFKTTSINLFSQKNNWRRVINENQMPRSYKEGSLFISSKQVMPWG